MCRTFVTDLIDFQVSDAWRDHYFEMGLTPFHSSSYRFCKHRIPWLVQRAQMDAAARSGILRELAQALLFGANKASQDAPQPERSNDAKVTEMDNDAIQLLTERAGG